MGGIRMNIKDPKFLIGLIEKLRKLPHECEWVEFKKNYADEKDIGEYISALSNSAALLGKHFAYLVWGIDNTTHEVIGTTFNAKMRIGNEELESWLLRLLNPKIDFQLHSVDYDGKNIVILEIPCAYRHPVSFQHVEYIRIGSYKKKLREFPEKERKMWRIFENLTFEHLLAKERVSMEDVLRFIDYQTFFTLLKQTTPEKNTAIINALMCENIITECDAGGYNITNLGAVLFARNLNDFSKFRRKAVRVICYKGSGRIDTIKEQIGGKGYASGFEGLIEYIMALVPTNEVIGKALRQSVPMYPALAVRELVANALIHQDFFETGCGPMIELFENRIEITNPGQSLVPAKRILGSPPKSRNETLASLMRRFGICEERGSGFSKVVSQTEIYQLPAPLFETPNEFTRTVLFAHQDFEEMDRVDRVRACYLHCSLQYLQRQKMTNKSLRERFGLPEKKGYAVSRVINATTEEKLIVINNAESKRNTSYVPYWSVSEKENYE
jgi:predicted HTH transcriptional regulator